MLSLKGLQVGLLSPARSPDGGGGVRSSFFSPGFARMRKVQEHRPTSVGVPAPPAVLSLREQEIRQENKAKGTHVAFIAASLMMSMVGPGLLCIPSAFKSGGLILSLIALLLSGAAAEFTAELMIRCHLMSGCYSYDNLAVTAFGKKSVVQRLVAPTNFIAIFGACCGYIRIVLTLVPLLGYLPWSIRTNVSNYIGAVLFAVLAFPFCLMKDISRLRYVSIAGFGFSLFLVGCIIYQSIQESRGLYAVGVKNVGFQPELVVWGNGVSTTFALYSFAFVVHLNIIPSFNAMTPEAKSPSKMFHVIRCVFATVVILYAATGAVAYSVYGTLTSGNILENLPPLTHVYIARTTVILLSLFGFPLIFMPLRGTLRQCLYGPSSSPTSASFLFNFTESFLLLVSTFLMAVLVPGIGFIFSFTGCTAVVMLIFVFPCAFYIKLRQKAGDQAIADGSGGGGVKGALRAAGSYNSFVSAADGPCELKPPEQQIEAPDNYMGSFRLVVVAWLVIVCGLCIGTWHLGYLIYGLVAPA